MHTYAYAYVWILRKIDHTSFTSLPGFSGICKPGLCSNFNSFSFIYNLSCHRCLKRFLWQPCLWLWQASYPAPRCRWLTASLLLNITSGWQNVQRKCICNPQFQHNGAEVGRFLAFLMFYTTCPWLSDNVRWKRKRPIVFLTSKELLHVTAHQMRIKTKGTFFPIPSDQTR